MRVVRRPVRRRLLRLMRVCERLRAVLAVVAVGMGVLLVDSRVVPVRQNMSLVMVHWLWRGWWRNRGKWHGRTFAFSRSHAGARVIHHAVDVGGAKTIEIAVELVLIPAC
jgi:hypothetical protein